MAAPPPGSPPPPHVIQLVGNSLRNEYSKTRSVVIKSPTTVRKNLCNYTEENLRIHAERKSAKLALHVSLAPALIQCSHYSRREYLYFGI